MVKLGEACLDWTDVNFPELAFPAASKSINLAGFGAAGGGLRGAGSVGFGRFGGRPGRGASLRGARSERRRHHPCPDHGPRTTARAALCGAVRFWSVRAPSPFHLSNLGPAPFGSSATTRPRAQAERTPARAGRGSSPEPLARARAARPRPEPAPSERQGLIAVMEAFALAPTLLRLSFIFARNGVAQGMGRNEEEKGAEEVEGERRLE